MNYTRICNMSCPGCMFSGINDLALSKSLAVNKAPLCFAIESFSNLNIPKSLSLDDIPNEIVLKKVSNDTIDVKIFSVSKINRIIYHVKFEDLKNEETLKQIFYNIDTIITAGILVRLYIFASEKSQIVESFKILHKYKNLSINFYSDKYFKFDNYPDINFHEVCKVNVSDLLNNNICEHYFLKNAKSLYDYKS